MYACKFNLNNCNSIALSYKIYVLILVLFNSWPASKSVSLSYFGGKVALVATLAEQYFP